MAKANEKARAEADRILEEQRRAEEEKKKAEEAKKAKAAVPKGPAVIDLSYWQSLYPDVVGYIYNPGTAISYPIVYGNTDFYMSHNLDGQEDVNGSIVLSVENNPSFSSGVWPSSGHILTLSTCSYEHENWRYVVLGDMVPIS